MTTRTPKAFTKHRRATVDLQVDFTDALARRAGPPTLTGSPTVEVTRRTAADGWDDVTAEFGVANISVSSPNVTFRLGPGAAAVGSTPATQDGGEYRVRIDVPATTGETLVSTHVLLVHEDGDPEAPAG